MTTALVDEKTTTKDKPTKIVENYQYYHKAPNKDKSIRWVCKTNKCSALVTTMDDVIMKINGKLVDLEDLDVSFEEKIKNSHKSHCKPLSTADKICMDFNINMKKRIGEENSSIQQIFQNEQSNMIKKLQDMDIVTEGFPQFYNV